MQRALSFDRSPPLAVAFRFFLNVPVFLLLAALVLGWLAVAESPFTRWNPGVLAVAHLLTLGVLASAMLGAMMQILPVATHIRVLHPRLTSTFVHACLSAGTLSLALGFLTSRRVFYSIALALLAAAFAVFLCAAAGGLLRDRRQRSPGSKEILVAVRFALAALAITLVLGIFMAGLRAGLWQPGRLGAGIWLHTFPDLHVLWGLAGWVGLLVIGISYQVIPIFQATEIYPRRMTDALAPLIFLLLAAFTVMPAWQPAAASVWRSVPASLLALGYLLYAATTTWLLWTRKRPGLEPTTWFWHVAMASLALAALVGAAYPWVPGHHGRDGAQMLLGTLLIPGFAVSAVNGMLYKIVPFLLWHNAQRRAPMALPFMPKVRQFIAERDAMRQFAAHAGAVALLAAACVAPRLLLPAAIMLAASGALLAWNMAQALRLYFHSCRRIDEAMARHAAATTGGLPGAQSE
ncbi:hypothetical protein H0A73_18780 [Alcaligenaceae bacterium]|nr:hypothetical protein [Alcaligenaceae bacterium]